MWITASLQRGCLLLVLFYYDYAKCNGVFVYFAMLNYYIKFNKK
jgi:hypothetical protein